jgi:hypothetical protein
MKEGPLLLNWIKKKKQETVKAKAIAPNNKLYLLLLLGAIAMTGLSLFVQGCDAAFTIWTSITCGGIASIVVAWLIDAANCKQLNKKAVEHRKTLLSNLYHVFDNGLQLLILEGAEKDQCTDSKRWYEWIETVDKQAMKAPALIPSFIRSLMVFFDDLSERVFAVKSQEAMLLESGIICQEDIQALSTILSICDLVRSTYLSKDNNHKCFQQLSTYCGLIHGLIGFAPSLRSINDMMIEPTLYRKCLEAQEETRTSEASQAIPVSNPKQEENETNE